MTEGAVADQDGAPRLRRWSADLRELMGSNFLQNVIGTLGSRAVLLALGVLTAVIVTRALGPEGRGLYATAVALSAIGVQLGNMGLHASNTWAVARDRSLLGALVANSLLASAIVGGAIVALFMVAVLVRPDLAPLDIDLLLLSLISVPIGLAYLLLQNLLLGTDRVRAYNALEVAVRAAATVALVGLVIAGAITAFSAYAVAVVLTGIAGLLALGLLTRGMRLPMAPSRTLMIEHARYGLKAYVAAMVAFLLLRVDVLFVQFILGSEETGYYAVAVSLADNIYVVPVVVSVLLFARLSAIPDGAKQWRLARSAAAGLGAIMTVAVLAAAVLAEPVVEFLFGASFLPSVPAFLWLMPGIVMLSFNTPLMNYFAAIGNPLVVIIGPLSGLLLNLVLNAWMIPAFGIVGASVASTLSYGLMLMVSIMYIWHASTGRAASRDSRTSE